MVRMSDILKRMGGGEEEDLPKKSVVPIEERKESREDSSVQFRKGILPTTQLSMEDAEQLYDRFLKFAVEEIFEKVEAEDFAIEGKKIQEAVIPIVDFFLKGNNGLLYFATVRSTPDYYLHAHAVNACIYAIALGIAFGYEREALIPLAIGALLHDMGMVKVMDLAQQKRALSPEERKVIEKHVRFNVDFLKKVTDLPAKSILIAQHVHERYDGGGYPVGLSGKDLSEEAQIVALCDIYEALTHPRSYRDRLSPYDALKEILKGRDLFDPVFLKLFIQQLTIYPVGCWVELSTGEQGQVIQTAAGSPLRPTLKILFDSRKKRLAVPKVIHLSQHATLFVKKSLQEKEMLGRGESVS